MFKRKKKDQLRPMGVALHLQINEVTLSDLAFGGEMPKVSEIASSWFSENCTIYETTAMFVNTLKGVLMVTNDTAYRDFPIDVHLPYPFGKQKTKSLCLRRDDIYVTVEFEDVAILAFPVENLINLLVGNPVREHKNAKKNALGTPLGEPIVVSSVDGELPIESALGDQFFTYKTAAAKLSARPLSAENLPLNLSSTD